MRPRGNIWSLLLFLQGHTFSHSLHHPVVLHWRRVHECHNASQYLHGAPAAQTPSDGTTPPPFQPLSQAFPWDQRHPHHPARASTFVSLYVLHSMFAIFIIKLPWCSLWLMPISALLTTGFHAVSPFVLVLHETRVPRFCFLKGERPFPWSWT